MTRRLRTHWVFLVVLIAGAVLRLLCLVAYPRSALTFVDSWRYVLYAAHVRPDPLRPIGYSLWLRTLFGAHPNLFSVVIVQHLLGLTTGCAIYLLMRRHRVRPALAAFAAAPVLLDGFQLDIEQFILSEAVFGVLLAATVLALLWWQRPPLWAATLAGVALATAILVRSVGLVLVPLALVLALVNRWGWRRAVLLATGVALPLLGYATWFASAEGSFALERFNGYAADSRVSQFADCRGVRMPAAERELCISIPRGHRPSPDFYTWDRRSPIQQYEKRHHLIGLYQSGSPSPRVNALALSFSRRIILHQPWDYTASVLAEIARYFGPTRSPGKYGYPVATWQFPRSDTWPLPHQQWAVRGRPSVVPEPRSSFVHYTNDAVTVPASPHAGSLVGPAARYRRGAVNASTAGFLHSYQSVVNVPGLPLALAVPAAALLLLPRVGASPARRNAAVWLAVGGVAVVVETALSTIVEFRYLLPLLVLMPPALVLAVDAAWARGATTEPGYTNPVDSGSLSPGATPLSDEGPA